MKTGSRHTLIAIEKNRLKHLGKISWNKSMKLSPEIRKNMSEGGKGKVLSLEHKRNISINNKGKHSHVVSNSAREKLRQVNLGKKHSEATKEKQSVSIKKYYNSDKSLEARQKISITNSREKHYKWIENRDSLKVRYNSEERRSSKYKYWRRQVCNRDKWKCRLLSNECKGRLEVHHVLGFKEYPELKFIINNGITLCHFHHPRVREEEKRMIPIFQELLSVSEE